MKDSPTVASLTRRLEQMLALNVGSAYEQVQRDALAVRQAMNLRGLLNSSMTVAALHDAYSSAIGTLCSDDIKAIKQLTPVISSVYSDDLRAEVQSLCATNLATVAQRLAQEYENDVKRAGLLNSNMVANRIPEIQRVMLERQSIEVNVVMDGAQYAHLQTGTRVTINNLTFNGPAGAVQTGDNANANVQMTVQWTTESRDAVIHCLSEIERLARESGAASANQVASVAHSAREVVAGDATPRTALKVYFDVLTAFIQSVPAAQPAFETLRGLLLKIGAL